MLEYLMLVNALMVLNDIWIDIKSNIWWRYNEVMIKLVIEINTPGAAGLLDLMTYAEIWSLGEA
jgi:hypothetical protein